MLVHTRKEKFFHSPNDKSKGFPQHKVTLKILGGRVLNFIFPIFLDYTENVKQTRVTIVHRIFTI